MQLPASPTGFAGRRQPLAWLADAARHGPALICGPAGVGKTALAVHWAYGQAERFPDGRLYVNLRGFDPVQAPLDPADVLRDFLVALGVPSGQISPGQDGRATQLRAALADRRVLLVLDNAADAGQVRPLLPGGGGSRALVTSRHQLAVLIAGSGARALLLDPLSDAEAWTLLAGRLGQDLLNRESAAAHLVIEHCHRLPFALTVVAARIASEPSATLAKLAEQVGAGAPTARLDALSVGDHAVDVRAVLSWSITRLAPTAARLLRLMSAHPGPDIGIDGVAILLDGPLADARAAIGDLLRYHLAVEPRPGRYELHDLTRAYAAEQSDRYDGAELPAVRARLVDHYLSTAHAAATLVFTHRDPIELPAMPNLGRSTPFASRSEALDWFDAEYPVLSAALDLAVAERLDDHVEPLAWSLVAYCALHGKWRDVIRGHQASLAVAQRRGDVASAGRSHLAIAVNEVHLGEFHRADHHFQAALTAFEDVGDTVGMGHVYSNRARGAGARSAHAEALTFAEAAYDRYVASGNERFIARGLSGLGWYHAAVGDVTAAVRCCTEALQLLTATGDRDGVAATWDSLGYARHHAGDFDKAVESYTRSLHMHVEDGDRYNQSVVLTHRGDTHLAAGDAVRAGQDWRRALSILEDLDHADAPDVRARLARITVQTPTARE
jgi:tetratricopeptide (TPR) repeat protein